MDRDAGVMSFENGTLALASMVFTPYDTMPDETKGSVVARHHIHLPYMGQSDTPLLDKVLGSQFDTGKGTSTSTSTKKK